MRGVVFVFLCVCGVVMFDLFGSRCWGFCLVRAYIKMDLKTHVYTRLRGERYKNMWDAQLLTPGTDKGVLKFL